MKTADMQNISYTPSIKEINDHINNRLFNGFCQRMADDFRAAVKPEFSKCSWEHGWNAKFKKSSKSLCTVYPREGYFTVMVVISQKEKERTEAILPELSPELQEIYHKTREGNGQRWLMVDLEDSGRLYDDVLRLIQIRSESR